jgi:hypothetical protein
VTPPKVSDIKSALQSNLITTQNQTITINDVSRVATAADPNSLITNAGLSKDDGGPYSNTISNTSRKFKFTIDQDDIDITVI